VPKPIRETASNAFSKVKSSILELYNNANEKLRLIGEVEEQAKKEHNEERSRKYHTCRTGAVDEWCIQEF